MSNLVGPRERQENIYRVLSARPYEPMTYLELAHELGYVATARTLSRDLSAVRHRALDDGNEITNCWWDNARRAHVFCFLPGGQPDQGMAMRPLVRRGITTRTYVRNTARHGEWVATNGADPVARAYGRFQAEASTATTRIYEAAENLLRELSTKESA